MQARISSALGAAVLLIASAAAAEPFPCASVAPEVRESVRAAGACRDVMPGDAAPKDGASTSTVTLTLSDGTVVRVPLEIGASITDGRSRPAVNKVVRGASASAQSASNASESSASAPQKIEAPPVIGSSDADTTGPNPITAPSAAPASTAPATATETATAATTPSIAAPATASAPTVEPRGPSSTSDDGAALIPGLALVGLSIGVLLMGHWLLHRPRAAGSSSFALAIQQHQQQVDQQPIGGQIDKQPIDQPTIDQQTIDQQTKDRQPVDTAIGGVSPTEAMPDIRFAARRDPGETKIALSPLPAADEFVIESPSGHPA